MPARPSAALSTLCPHVPQQLYHLLQRLLERGLLRLRRLAVQFGHAERSVILGVTPQEQKKHGQHFPICHAITDPPVTKIRHGLFLGCRSPLNGEQLKKDFFDDVHQKIGKIFTVFSGSLSQSIGRG